MISKSDFIAKVRLGNPALTGDEPDFAFYDDAAIAAAKVLAAMPGIGFASVTKRFNAFIAVCRHLDMLVKQREVTSSDAQLAILILRFSSTPFLKAAIAFDIKGPRLRTSDAAELPEAAYIYLAGLKAYG